MATALRTLVGQYICSLPTRTTSALAAARRSFHPRGPEITALIRRLASGVGLLIFSVLLGITAHKQTARDTLRDWENRNPPSGDLWLKLLKSQGFAEIQGGSRKNSLIRHHPGRWDEPGETWIATPQTSDSPRWIAILAPGTNSQATELRVFESLDCAARKISQTDGVEPPKSQRASRRKKASLKLVSSEPRGSTIPVGPDLPNPTAWRPLGQGWSALKAWSEIPDSRLPQSTCTSADPKGGQRERISRRNSDARAFRY